MSPRNGNKSGRESELERTVAPIAWTARKQWASTRVADGSGAMPGVEIKANVDAVEIDSALRAFERDGEGSPAVIRFAEDTTVGAELPLLAAGIVLRGRQRKDDDDVTVKLRPCRRSQLTQRWLDGDGPDDCERKLEQDWCGNSPCVGCVLSRRAPIRSARCGG